MSQTALTFFEHSLISHEKRTCHAKIRQLISRITTHLAFSAETTIDLTNYGLIPIYTVDCQETILRELETSIPLLNFKTLIWHIHFSQSTHQLALKIGTGNRINQCDIILTLHQKQENNPITVHCQLDGAQLKDNHWAIFTFNEIIPAGEYACQLQSPNADNQVNTLFIWLTVPYKAQAYHLGNYCYNEPNKADLQLAVNKLTKNESIGLILYVSDETYLLECLNSIFAQIYPHWSLYIIVDKNIILPTFEQKYQNHIKIIHFTHLTEVSSICYRLFNQLSNQWVILLQSTDILTIDALFELINYINKSDTPVMMLYSDEDSIDDKNHYVNPYFKPNWSNELLKGQFYLGQLIIYPVNLIKQIVFSANNIAFTALLWDIALKISEKIQTIQHIPKILCHRYANSSANLTIDTLTCIQAALTRENLGGAITLNPIIPTTYLLNYPVIGQPQVSIIIPIKDKIELLIGCINSILAITTYNQYEFIIVDNGSTAAKTLTTLAHYKELLNQRINIISQPGEFNFSRLVNNGVKHAHGEIILLLNNDMQLLTSPHWLQILIGFAQHPEIGAVGCKLLYPEDNTIQHAGIICGIGGVANHPHRHYSVESVGYFNRLAVVANYSAITGACLMIERKLWNAVGGFDENLAIAFNDVDFCLKLSEKGFRHVVVPQVIFYHDESKTRGLEDSDEKQQRLKQEHTYLSQRWQNKIIHDPFYNPHLTPYTEDFSLNPHSIYYCETYDVLL